MLLDSLEPWRSVLSGQQCKGKGIFSQFLSLPLDDDAIKDAKVHAEVRPKGTAAPFPDVVWGQGVGRLKKCGHVEGRASTGLPVIKGTGGAGQGLGASSSHC